MGHADGTPAPAPGSACFSPLPHPPPHLAWPSGGQARQVLCASRDHLHPLSAKGAHLLEFELSVVSPTSETEQGKQTTPPRPSRATPRAAAGTGVRTRALRGPARASRVRRVPQSRLRPPFHWGIAAPCATGPQVPRGPAPCALRPAPSPSSLSITLGRFGARCVNPQHCGRRHSPAGGS